MPDRIAMLATHAPACTQILDFRSTFLRPKASSTWGMCSQYGDMSNQVVSCNPGLHLPSRSSFLDARVQWACTRPDLDCTPICQVLAGGVVCFWVWWCWGWWC